MFFRLMFEKEDPTALQNTFDKDLDNLNLFFQEIKLNVRQASPLKPSHLKAWTNNPE